MGSLRKAFERCARALSLWTSHEPGVHRTRARVTEALRCEIEEGVWKLTADMPEQLGGRGGAPTPGTLGRAALSSCLAIGYMLHASRQHVAVTALEVEIETVCDESWLVGPRKTPVREQNVRYTVTVESPASEEEVRRVIEESDVRRQSLHVFAVAPPRRKAVRIVRPRASAGRLRPAERPA